MLYYIFSVTSGSPATDMAQSRCSLNIDEQMRSETPLAFPCFEQGPGLQTAGLSGYFHHYWADEQVRDVCTNAQGRVGLGGGGILQAGLVYPSELEFIVGEDRMSWNLGVLFPGDSRRPTLRET